MEEIKKIDQALETQLKKLEDLAQELEWKVVGEFRVNDDFALLPLADLRYMGVYLIEVKNDSHPDDFGGWFEIFEEKWEDEKYLKKRTPRLIKKRVRSSVKRRAWIPLYLGKSSNIRSRIEGHVNLKLEQATYALKLNARKNLCDYTFRLSTIRLDVDSYDAIMPVVESCLREREQPLIGRQ